MSTYTIQRTVNHGTIVQVDLIGGPPERPNESIFFDHRPFSHLYEGERGDIIGRLVELLEDEDGNQSLAF